MRWFEMRFEMRAGKPNRSRSVEAIAIAALLLLLGALPIDAASPATEGWGSGNLDGWAAVDPGGTVVVQGVLPFDWRPHLATDRAGHRVAVWEANTGIGAENHFLHATSSDNGWTWTAPAPMTAVGDGLDDSKPRVAFGGGRWIAVWMFRSRGRRARCRNQGPEQ